MAKKNNPHGSESEKSSSIASSGDEEKNRRRGNKEEEEEENVLKLSNNGGRKEMAPIGGDGRNQSNKKQKKSKDKKKNKRITSPETNEIDIRLDVRRALSITANRSDKIKDIKAKFCSQEGISVSLQEITLDGKPLEDGRTLASYDIRRNSNLALRLETTSTRRLVIKVPRKACFEITAKITDSIRYIKTIVESKVGIPSGDFYLMRGDGKLLVDSATLASLNIASESKVLHVYCLPKDRVLWISVHTVDKGSKSLEVFRRTPVSDVKALVESLAETSTSDQVLMYGRRVMDDSKELGHYVIKNHELLVLRTGYLMLARTWIVTHISFWNVLKALPQLWLLIQKVFSVWSARSVET